MPLNNFGFVHNGMNGNIYRSAQPDKLGFEYLHAIGVDTIFKLNHDNEFSFEEEKKLFPYGCVTQCDLPELYRGNSLNCVISIARLINEDLLNKHDIHIHCSHGRDRTGLVAAAWQLMFDGKDIKQINADRPAYGCNCLIEMFDSPDRHILSEIYLLKCGGKL